ncbi:MAG: cytochrome P450 [Anaerolineaceae bacterium]|nr:MAG: cytochrome P450 [Anaerolineaceae bacterium]
MNPNSRIPKDKCPDSTLRLLKEGYLFIPNRCHIYKSDVFSTRIMGKKVVCISGATSAEIFYNNELMTRKKALPKRIQKTLFGVKAIQTMDGMAHKHRKKLFLSIMSKDRVELLNRITKSLWARHAKEWTNYDTLVLFDEAAKVFCKAACIWSGIPIKNADAKILAKDLTAMVDAFGGIGLRYWKGRLGRIRTEYKMKQIITKVRQKKLTVATDSALYKIAFYKTPSGKLLDPNTAGIELINILRPITAISTYITFGALALHQYPKYKDMIAKNKLDPYLFAQEIRRYYPFGPFLGAKVKNDFIYNNYYFKKGTLIFLDIYGTNHDERIWKNPSDFYPERFNFWNGNPFNFIPQGGGDPSTGHRCPGEWVTIMLLKSSIEFLVNHLSYDIPLQDFSYSLRRMPTIPKSRFIINRVKHRP